MSPIDDSLQHILERIDAASQRYGRNDQVGLMLAVKTQTPQTIVQATNALA
ncbi:MAG: YggS family pyridoxal phosphate-dependent enzyme, partial [Actinomyces graevenitzii]|nr:YggS family pyridoxal phosphate-dependent enzyme [Actinomyces graevenitzii]